MRPLRPRPEAAADPAPSRMAYKMHRLWLSPRIRRALTLGLPGLAAAALIAAWAAQPAHRAALAKTSQELRAAVAARPEFQIRQLAITGAEPVLDREIRRRLDLNFPISWFDLDAQAVAAEVATLDVVKDVTVTLELGGALRLAVTQRDPAALWRHSGGLEVLDDTGHRIGFLDRRDGRPDLPLVTGPGADRAIPEALQLIALARPLAPRLIALTRQGARRWDVVLARDQRILLPAQGAQAALERVLAMAAAEELLDRDIAVIDLRDPRRPTLRLGPDAQDYRAMTLSFVEEMRAQ